MDVELDLSPGVLLAPQVLTELDAHGDRSITDAEARAYGGKVLKRVVLRVDNQALALTTTRTDTPVIVTVSASA